VGEFSAELAAQMQAAYSPADDQAGDKGVKGPGKVAGQERHGKAKDSPESACDRQQPALPSSLRSSGWLAVTREGHSTQTSPSESGSAQTKRNCCS
jgi:hypothetical protein